MWTKTGYNIRFWVLFRLVSIVVPISWYTSLCVGVPLLYTYKFTAPFSSHHIFYYYAAFLEGSVRTTQRYLLTKPF